ncbi:hypothetical protein [Rhodopirellula sp. P2]|uniref:hypothetical protein n=1 Tax=Rhodopirellula sp. P2 TaxID=2127060 RepID=UPI0023676BC1|nr:hypothetical protein [Rhodopirellula sp. P2]WDQ15580.1 hypothetical protein PSR62_18295 [Rhodopirellula sp. P2]
MKLVLKKRALVGPRRFQWQVGGWFGGVAGGTAWMLPVAGGLAFNGQPALALLPLGCGVLMGSVGCFLWYKRDRVRPFQALIGLLILFSITTPLVWFVVGANATPTTLASLNWPHSGWVDALVALICPAMIVAFCLREFSLSADLNQSGQEIR